MYVTLADSYVSWYVYVSLFLYISLSIYIYIYIYTYISLFICICIYIYIYIYIYLFIYARPLFERAPAEGTPKDSHAEGDAVLLEVVPSIFDEVLVNRSTQ